MSDMQRIHHPWPPESTMEMEEVVRAALEDGMVMAYPTETAYALGGNALLPWVADAVFRLKGRPAAKALLLLIDGSAGVDAWAEDVSPEAEALMERFWPGPLTLVFKASHSLPAHLIDPRGTVALRWSPHPCIDTLLRIGRAPLIGTSANISGRGDPHTADDVLTTHPSGIDLLIDGGPTPGGATTHGSPSTLVDTTTHPFQVLRPGALDSGALRTVVPDLVD